MDSRSTVTTVASSARDPKRRRSREDEDIISNLPESLISQILSRLPVRDAVRTSVLSKEWICRWTCVPKLALDDRVFYVNRNRAGKQKFIDFVNKALLLTSNSSVESFHLCLVSNIYDPSLVNIWISSILHRDVKKLKIDASPARHISSQFGLVFSAVSSHLLFRTCNLEELVLNMHCCAIRAPKPYVYFRHLKFLDLSEITFTLDFPSDSKDVVLDFPVLKEFKTKNCNWLGVKCVTLKVPLLERFFIEHQFNSKCEELHNCVVSNCAVNICALRLTEFTCDGSLSQDIFLVDPSSAKGVVANIALYHCNNANPTVQEAETRACKLLKQFSQAKCLKLKAAFLAKSKVLSALPQFGMLTHLELVRFSVEVLLDLLHMSPFIKTLDIKGLVEFDFAVLSSVDVPNCLLSTVEVVKFGRVYGGRHELCLAKFLVENATVLKTMSISHSRPKWLLVYDWRDFEVFKVKLISFKEGFNSTTTIDFISNGDFGF